MKFSEKWLRKWVNPPLTTDELTDMLTMGGLEVDSVAPAAPEFSGVVVARIISAEPHPDADRLQVCKVNRGGEENIDIVCGAANARTGLVTALATVGAVLPGGMKIKKAKLRGVPSFGMLASAAELGLEDKAEGIIELPADAPVGQDLRDYLGLDDTVIEVDLTPNRGDCFSIRGIARDVGVLCNTDVQEPEIAKVDVGTDRTLLVQIKATEACPRYVGRVITGINPNAETPIWIKETLRRSGLRPIHPIVDITNFVMLELGQPMHAFDLDKLEGGIIVRHANDGEKLSLLDGQEIIMKPDTLVIADHNQALALAGIMGGSESAVSEETVNIFLESAFFTPRALAGKARRYKAQTDSSHRFERGVDFDLQERATERASALILNICGGQAGPVSLMESAGNLPERSEIVLRKERISRLLGAQFDDQDIENYLSRLGMHVDSHASGWRVTAPSHRFDIEIEADLIEEIARVMGYDRLPASKPVISMSIKSQPEAEIELQRLRSVLIARGYQEAITYSFVEQENQYALMPDLDAVPLANPISSDMAVMRTSLLPGLLQALIYNLNRQHNRIRLFETGLIFYMDNKGIEQQNVFGGIVTGHVLPEQWGVKGSPADFFDLKNDVEALLSLSGTPEEYTFSKVQHAALHPGQSAVILRQGKEIGYLGMVSPTILKKLDLDQDIGFFQLDLNEVLNGRVPEFEPISKFPLVRRDISLLVDKDVEIAQIVSSIRENAPETLTNLQLFDVYQGEGIDSMKKSVALGLIFQGTSSTLVDHQIDESVNAILKKLEKGLGATLR